MVLFSDPSRMGPPSILRSSLIFVIVPGPPALLMPGNVRAATSTVSPTANRGASSVVSIGAGSSSSSLSAIVRRLRFGFVVDAGAGAGAGAAASFGASGSSLSSASRWRSTTSDFSTRSATDRPAAIIAAFISLIDGVASGAARRGPSTTAPSRPPSRRSFVAAPPPPARRQLDTRSYGRRQDRRQRRARAVRRVERVQYQYVALT